MKKNILFFLLLSIIFISCSQKEELKLYEFKNVKTIGFPLDSTKTGKPTSGIFDYDTIDGRETIIVMINKNRLAFYDIATQQEYHSIPLLKTREILMFDYINKDSILVFYENQYMENSYTEEGKNVLDIENLQLLNYWGESKICTYNFDKNDFSDSLKQTDIIPFPFIYYIRLFSVKEKYFFPTCCFHGNILGTSEEKSHKYPVFCYYDLLSKKVKISKSIKFPYYGDSIFYNTNFPKIHYCLSSNKLPLIRFFYSSDVFEWDYNKDIVKRHSIKSRIFDTIYSLATAQTAPEALAAMYSDIYYDPYNERYYSFLLIPDFCLENVYRITIIYDKDFNYLGETTEASIGYLPIFTEKYIIEYYYSNDSILLHYSVFNKTDKALQPYIDSVKNEINKSSLKQKNVYKRFKGSKNPLISFLQSTKVKKKNEKDYVLLTIYESGACPYCKDLVKQIISQNNDVFAGLPFYLILSGSKDRVLAGSYETFEKLKFIQDTAGIAEQLAYKEGKYSMLNPRLTVVKDNKIVFDTIYDAFHIESDLIPNLIESLNLQEKK